MDQGREEGGLLGELLGGQGLALRGRRAGHLWRPGGRGAARALVSHRRGRWSTRLLSPRRRARRRGSTARGCGRGGGGGGILAGTLDGRGRGRGRQLGRSNWWRRRRLRCTAVSDCGFPPPRQTADFSYHICIYIHIETYTGAHNGRVLHMFGDSDVSAPRSLRLVNCFGGPRLSAADGGGRPVYPGGTAGVSEGEITVRTVCVCVRRKCACDSRSHGQSDESTLRNREQAEKAHDVRRKLTELSLFFSSLSFNSF